MITHIALFRWAEGTTSEQVQAFADGLDAMVPKVPTIRGYRHGRDLGVTEGAWDYAVVAEFDSVADYRAYAAHPVHVDVSTTLVRPIIGELARVQLGPSATDVGA